MTSVVDSGHPDAAARAPVRAPPSSGPPPEGVADLVDTGRAGAALAYLPKRPWLARDGNGRPVLSLTIVLARRPAPDERDVLLLAERGQLSFDATLVVPASELAATGVTVAPAFARSAAFALTTLNSELELARATASGPGARAALTASLDGAQSREVIAALAGRESRMRLSVDLVVDHTPAPSRVTLQAGWAVLYDAIAYAAAGAADFDVAVIERALQQMVSDGALSADVAPADLPPTEVLGVAIRGLLRSGGMIFERVPGAQAGRYRLTEKPAPEFMWRYDERLTVPATRKRSIAAPLEDVLGGALDGQDWSAFVRLVAPDGAQMEYAAVPRLCRGEVESVERDPGGAASSSMVLVNATLLDGAAVTATSRPFVRPTMVASGQNRQMWLADGVLDYLRKQPVRSLPVTTSGTEALFPDRLDRTRRWYVPTLAFVEPNPAGDPDSASFLYSFERIGTATSGDAALAGTVRVVLQTTVPEAVRAALAAAGNPPAQPVEMLDMNVELSVPFVDSADNTRKRTTLRGTVEHVGSDVIATFAIADRWVRLVYAVLSSPGFQDGEQASLRYSFRYECYREVTGATVRPINGVKQALIPIDWTEAHKASGPLVFNARAGLLAAGATQIRFVPESAAAVAAERGPQEHFSAAATARPVSVAASRPATAAAVARPIGDMAMKPLPVMIRPSVIDVRPPLREIEYIQQSVGVQGATDLLIPCNRFGTLYRQKIDAGWHAIGCQDAFRLGTVPAKLYEEIGALANSWLRVYRCLPQPGRFLVLPRAYRIARYPPGHERSYLPAAMVYAVLDATVLASNRYRFVATVEPDIPPFVLRALRASLAAYAPAASLELNLPTDVATNTDLPSMPLASILSPPRFTVAGNGVQVVLESEIADALVLRSAVETGGVLGRLAFTFEDSSSLESEIEIVLGQIAGPWGAGPASAKRSGGTIRLTNHIDRALDVSLLRLYVAATAATEVAVGERIEAGASIDVAVADSDAEVAIVYSVASSGPRTLEECRVYMEDVSTNVIFTCGINYAARGIADIEVYARLGADGTEKRVRLSDALPRMGTAEFMAPLSSVVGAGASSPTIQYRVVRVMTAGERVAKPWAPCPSAVVDIQWELVA